MGTLTAQGISVEEYLSNPEYEHFEYIDGAVRELNLGTVLHSHWQVQLVLLLGLYLRANPIGFVYTEVHCQLPGPRKRFFLPDVSVTLGPRRPGRYVDAAPELVVEIRSPDDAVSEVVRKMQEWLAAGARLGWLVIPEEQALWVFRAGEPPVVLTGEDSVEGGELLPGLAFRVSELFAE